MTGFSISQEREKPHNSNSNLYSYVENYKSYFLNNSVPVIQARLITYDE